MSGGGLSGSSSSLGCAGRGGLTVLRAFGVPGVEELEGMEGEA